MYRTAVMAQLVQCENMHAIDMLSYAKSQEADNYRGASGLHN